MQDNPYAKFKETLDRSGSARPQWRTGTVLSVAPLAVDLGGIRLSGGDLLVNAGLLPRSYPVSVAKTGETMTGVSGSFSDEEGGHTLSSGELSAQGGTLAGVLTEGAGALLPGDRVVLLTQDDQTFILLCKVVAA